MGFQRPQGRNCKAQAHGRQGLSEKCRLTLRAKHGKLKEHLNASLLQEVLTWLMEIVFLTR